MVKFNEQYLLPNVLVGIRTVLVQLSICFPKVNPGWVLWLGPY